MGAGSKTLSSNSTEKNEQLEHLENACAHLVSNCLVQVLPDQHENNSASKSKSRSVLSEKLNDNFENTGSNKKAKVEVEWTWALVIGELKDHKDTSKQMSWSLITEKLIESGRIPEGFLLTIIDYIMEKIDALNLDNPLSASNSRKTLNSVNNLNSFTFQAIYFQVYYTILKSPSTQRLLHAQMNSKHISVLLTKTGLFFLKHLTRNSRFVSFLSDMVGFSYAMNTSFYKALVDKFSSLLSNSGAIRIDPGLLRLVAKVFELKQAEQVLSSDTRDALVDRLLVSFRSLKALGRSKKSRDLTTTDEDETNENCSNKSTFFFSSQNSSKSSDSAPTNTAIVSSMTNLARSQMFTHFYAARILTRLAGFTCTKSWHLKDSLECLGDHVKILFPAVFSKRSVDEKLCLLFEAIDKFYDRADLTG
jgi:hypothetical protein